MIAFPEMLIVAATEAGIKVPEDVREYDPRQFPHFKVLANIQLGRKMTSWDNHWINAKIISDIPQEQIMQVTLEDLVELGIE